MARKKKSLKNRKNSRQRERDEYTIALEDIRSQFRLFGEGLSHVSNTIDGHTLQLKVIEERLADLRIEMDFVKEQLALIRHNQVTREEFKVLETRVARLERTRSR